MQLKKMIKSSDEGAWRFTQMNGLKHVVEMIDHWKRADTFKELREGLRNKFTMNFILEMMKNLLSCVSIPCMSTPFFYLVIVQFWLYVVQDRLNDLKSFMLLTVVGTKELIHARQLTVVAFKLKLFIKITVDRHRFVDVFILYKTWWVELRGKWARIARNGKESFTAPFSLNWF